MAGATVQTNELRADNGQRIVVLDGLVAYENAPLLADMFATDLVCVQNLYEAIAALAASPIIFTLNAAQGPVYTLSADQLASVNAFNRYANFTALINGVRQPLIYESYVGSPGAFTSITVTWDAQEPLTVQFA